MATHGLMARSEVATSDADRQRYIRAMAEAVELLEEKAVGAVAGRFLVRNYQRGYRWGSDEVRRLLTDIRDSHGEDYYLQPIVVKRLDEDKWELVDGQQRLTTLYLILKQVTRHLPTARIKYTIEYETRPGSAAYLEDPSEADRDRNVDFFHMFNAYETIARWFDAQNNPTLAAIEFYQLLSKSVYIIWYEGDPNVDSTTLFTRLNVGRIPLTDAELVKALVLSRSRENNGQTDRALEIAAQWDGIERDLRNPELWAFVTGSAREEPTHISLLLDTLADELVSRPPGPRPLFHTFETLRASVDADPPNAKSVEELWNKIVVLHSLVLGWYDDRELFHKIGFLIATRDPNKRAEEFSGLIVSARNLTKTAFRAQLDDRIRGRLNLTESDLLGLEYRHAATARALLLMNVETILKNEGSTERYSFSEHASRRWSLEHIHAQNADELNRADQWEEWLRLHVAALESHPSIDEASRTALVDRIRRALAGTTTQDIFRALQHEVSSAFSLAGAYDEGEIDSITNLALLDSNTNSALSNAVFEVKRRAVIELDRAGAYIPVCTRNVFLKYYTTAASQQIHFWGAADRQGYLTAITREIRRYLKPDEVTRA